MGMNKVGILVGIHTKNEPITLQRYFSQLYAQKKKNTSIVEVGHKVQLSAYEI